MSDDAHKLLGAALGRIPSGLFIVTLARAKWETGLLASWVQQCSFQPPLITFAVKRTRAIVDHLTPGSNLTVNILESSQTDMIAHFGKGFSLEEESFRGVDVRSEPGQGPILKEALAYLYAKITEKYSVGDHQLFLAEVTSGSILNEGQPMTHVRKNGFHY